MEKSLHHTEIEKILVSPHFFSFSPSSVWKLLLTYLNDKFSLLYAETSLLIIRSKQIFILSLKQYILRCWKCRLKFLVDRLGKKWLRRLTDQHNCQDVDKSVPYLFSSIRNLKMLMKKPKWLLRAPLPQWVKGNRKRNFIFHNHWQLCLLWLVLEYL